MTDEFDDLKRAFDAATPAPDPVRKAENMRLAEENFARLQGSRSDARQTVQSGPLGRLLNGGKTMLDVMTSKGGLAATTAIVAVGLVMVTPVGEMLTGPKNGPVVLEKEPSSEVDAITRTDRKSDLAQTEANEQSRFRDEAVAGSGNRSDDLALRENAAIAPAAPVAPAEAEEETFVGDMVATEERGAASLDADGRLSAAEPQSAPSPSITGKIIGGADRNQAFTEGLESQIIAVDPPVVTPESDTEAFPVAPESALKVTAEEPVSTFSIDVDTASYAVVRSSLTAGSLPPKDAVRVEEMVNYFPYAYPAPDGEHPFRPTITVTPSPWNPGTEIVHIGIQGEMPAVEDRPPLNLVFLIDTSGSMQDPNKLPLLKQSFRLMLSELRPEDEVSIVTYAGSAGQVLEPTRAAERTVILAALDRLQAGGSTAGQAGLQQAYQVAEGMAGDGEVTRVILATDGDFNVGLSDPEALKDFIAEKRESGTYLSVLGFGRGNLDDATMQALAQNGNGTAAYIDTLSEARKVLVDQLTGALFPIANDVKIQVEFNPAEVAEYRLIGYETRALNREDFNNDKVDAGDIGAGHTVTAVYEITPVGSEAVRNGPLRYGDAAPASDSDGELGYFKLRYKMPGESQSILLEEPILPEMGEAGDDVRFSLAIAGFGQLLTGGTYLGGWDYDDAVALANAAKGSDPFGYRAEAVNLMRLAEALDR